MPKSKLFETEHQINEYISIKVPTVREILDDEDAFYQMISPIVSTPTDMMVQLDDAGIDFTEISEWELFCMLFEGLKDEDLSLILPNVDLSKYDFAKNIQTNEIVLWDSNTDNVIDRLIYEEMCTYIRNMLCLEKNVKKPANKEAKDFLIERARVKSRRQRRKRLQNKNELSTLEGQVLSLVCAPEFPYDFESVQSLTIYQFNMALKQVIHRIESSNLMVGRFAGTLDVKGIDPKKLSWLYG